VDEAKRLAYMGPERHKVVAQDGTLIAKSGCITGGLTGSEAERAQRFDEQRTKALKEVWQRLAVTNTATVLTDLSEAALNTCTTEWSVSQNLV
jgi:chromosome segregation ATPase